MFGGTVRSIGVALPRPQQRSAPLDITAHAWPSPANTRSARKPGARASIAAPTGAAATGGAGGDGDGVGLEGEGVDLDGDVIGDVGRGVGLVGGGSALGAGAGDVDVQPSSKMPIAAPRISRSYTGFGFDRALCPWREQNAEETGLPIWRILNRRR
ncbi:MAG: hypothetical protein JNL83_27090 [Myxococcales bacterium]|nr:hypothetical protein [Myxococcales bacterium]